MMNAMQRHTALAAVLEWTVRAMTVEQYKKYKEVEEEIRPLKTFVNFNSHAHVERDAAVLNVTVTF